MNIRSTLVYGASATAIAVLFLAMPVAAWPANAGSSSANVLRAGPKPADYSWTTRPWTNEDSAFLAEKKRIAAEMRTATDCRKLALRYKGQAIARPNDCLAAYRWGYAHFYAFVYRRCPRYDSERAPGAREAYDAMGRFDDTRCFEYDRVRFLLASQFEQRSKSDLHTMDAVGCRLIDKDPKDVSMRFWVASWMVSTSDVGMFKKALRMYTALAAERPSLPTLRAGMLLAHARLYWWTGDDVHFRAAHTIYAKLKGMKGVKPATLDEAKREIAFLETAPQIWKEYRQKQKRKAR